MDFAQAMQYLEEEDKRGNRGDLESIGSLLKLLGNPQSNLKYIHIAGTNGKGSVCAYLSEILIEKGYVIGQFTSPHIEHYCERIRINDEQISEGKVSTYVERIRDAVGMMERLGFGTPSYFEITLAVAMLYFQEKGVDLVLLETGVGGRHDPTNVVNNVLLSIITTISYDHMAQLGSTLPEIAYAKAGIIKDHSPVVAMNQPDEIKKVLLVEASTKDAPIIFLGEDQVTGIKMSDHGSDFVFHWAGENAEYHIRMVGQHQIQNAALAALAAVQLGISVHDPAMVNGLKNTKWLARLECLWHQPRIVIDGAHNKEGLYALLKAIRLYNYQKLILCIGTMTDKDLRGSLESLVGLSAVTIVTKIDYERGMAVERLAEELKSIGMPLIKTDGAEEAVSTAMSLAKRDDLILFTGSLYLMGEVRAAIRKILADMKEIDYED